MERATESSTEELAEGALRTATELCQRYRITALQDFLESCRSFAQEKSLNIAIFGRFKAGKSSFLNHLIGRPLLPVGVIPVTSAVTEIEYGRVDSAEARFLDGRSESIPLERIGDYISESHNPSNSKSVALVRVQSPSMGRYRGIRFVDTPGLESAFEHNTETSLEWLPRVGLALVAVGADAPLSQADLELIRNLRRYTPNVSLLLTKADILSEGERDEVTEFLRRQLEHHGDGSMQILPYSIRPGFESLRTALDERLLSGVHAENEGQRAAVLRHKIVSLLEESAGYLNVALKAAAAADSDRERLRRTILGDKAALDDTRLALRLIVRHAAGMARSQFEDLLRNDEGPVRQRLLAGLDREFPSWTRNLGVAITRLEDWLGAVLTGEMTALSKKHGAEFVEPVERVGRQLSQGLQDFRNRVSERTLEALGVPLKTTQPELRTEEPRSPDVRVGKIFDHNWELVSFLVPMGIVRGAVRKHFERTVENAVVVNLSRLASQWETAVNRSLLDLEKDSVRRLDGLIASIERLIASGGEEASRIREDLAGLDSLRKLIRGSSALII